VATHLPPAEKTLEEKHKQNEKAFEAYEKKIKHADEVNAVGGLSVRDQPTDGNDVCGGFWLLACGFMC
jgi:hypothetical protein